MDSTATSIFDLSPSEKLQLVVDLWDDLAGIPEAVPVHDWQKGNVHVVAARNTCPAVIRSPTMLAHEQRAPLSTRHLGAHAPGGAGLHPGPRSQGGGVGGHGPAVAGAAATRLAHFVAPAVERSASGRWPNGRGASPQGVGLAGNPDTRDMRGPWCRSSRWTWSSPSSPSAVGAASSPCRGRIRSPSGIR